MELTWECESPNAHYHHINQNRIPQNGYPEGKTLNMSHSVASSYVSHCRALVIEMIATTLTIFAQQRMMEVIICLCLTRWNWLKSVSHPTAPSYVFRSVTVPNCFVLPSTSVQHESFFWHLSFFQSFFCRSYSDRKNPGLEKFNNSVPAGEVHFVKIPIDNVLALRYYSSTFSLCWPAAWWFTATHSNQLTCLVLKPCLGQIARSSQPLPGSPLGSSCYPVGHHSVFSQSTPSLLTQHLVHS